MTRFAGDKNVVGRKVLVNNYPMTIVGVSAPAFNGLDPARSPKIRVPIQMLPIVNPGWDTTISFRRLQWARVFARLKPGYTLESAQASLQVLFTQIRHYEATLPEAKGWSTYNRERFLQASAIGRHLGFTILHPKPDIEIIGVIDNIIYSGPREDQRRQVFVAEPQETYLTGETFYV